jgi:hypothetical protein
MSQILELPDRIYEALTAAARRDGLTAAEWLEMQLRVSAASVGERPLSELLAGIIGAVDSTEIQNTCRTPFSTALAEKFRKQGLRIP